MVLTCLITGVGGFCGSHLAARLKAEGDLRVVGLGLGKDGPARGGCDEYLQADLCELAQVERAVRRLRPDLVFHLAGLREGSDEDVYRVNLFGSLQMLEALRRYAPRARILLVGTAAEYGTVDPVLNPVDERCSCQPVGAYARSKHAMVLSGLGYAHGYGLRIVVARPFNVIGPGMPPSLLLGDVLKRTREALSARGDAVVQVGNLDSERDFVAVGDVVDAYVRMLMGAHWGEIFNLCSGRLSVCRAVVERFLSYASRPVRLVVDPGLSKSRDPASICGSWEKAARAFGFEPVTSLERAIESAWRHEMGRPVPAGRRRSPLSGGESARSGSRVPVQRERSGAAPRHETGDRLDALTKAVTGRTAELFLPNLQAREREIEESVRPWRVLVIGGAGSIGTATVHVLATRGPRALHVVDQNENSLAELIRDLRSSGMDRRVGDIRMLPLDFGSPQMLRLLREEAPYDCVMNFAAVKHVRSEKDVPSLLHMLETNVVKPAWLLGWLREWDYPCRLFCVSTDKAANPVSLMGASKRILEHLMFGGEVPVGQKAQVSSARFPNVAFSDGSLLDGFLRRLQKRQPLVVPAETRRYFISLHEAAHLCLLATVCAPHGMTVVPRPGALPEPRDLQAVAVAVLRAHGFDARQCRTLAEAKAGRHVDARRGTYPLIVTERNTSGEKVCEEFIGDGERVVDIGLGEAVGLAYRPAPGGSLRRILDRIQDAIGNPEVPVTKEDIVRWLSEVLPNFRHLETGRDLDEQL